MIFAIYALGLIGISAEILLLNLRVAIANLAV
jgi:hypothetical protein